MTSFEIQKQLASTSICLSSELGNQYWLKTQQFSAVVVRYTIICQKTQVDFGGLFFAFFGILIK